MEIETRIAKHYKCHYRCVCKDYKGKVMKGGGGWGVSLHRFVADQKIASA